MALLDDGAWQGKLWTGAWTDGGGGTYDAVEPATGNVLGAVGRATPEEVHTAADRAVDSAPGVSVDEDGEAVPPKVATSKRGASAAPMTPPSPPPPPPPPAAMPEPEPVASASWSGVRQRSSTAR